MSNFGGVPDKKKSDRDYGPFPAILTFTIFATIIPEKDIRILSFCLPSFLAAEERRRASVCIINRYLARCVNRKKKRSCLRQETIIPQNIKEIRRQIVKNTSLLKIGTTKQSQKGGLSTSSSRKLGANYSGEERKQFCPSAVRCAFFNHSDVARLGNLWHHRDVS